MTTVVIDPVTRIEGHLRVQVEVNNGKVTDAWTTSTLFRGLEMIVENRPWMDAWHYTHRVCGVCPTPHGHNSSMSMENAAGIKIPPNARLMRNLLECAQLLHDHVLWFYVLNGLDYVDVASALTAKATGAAKALQDKVAALYKAGQLGFLESGYWGNPAYKLPPELNLQLLAHYLESVGVQATASEASAVFGGKFPYQMSTPPGGFSGPPPSQAQLDAYDTKVKQVQQFIDGVMVPDLLAIAPFYLDQAAIGRGYANYFSWGVLDDDVETGDPYKRFFPLGAIEVGKGLVVDKVNQEADVREWVTSSWNTQYPGGLHPWEGITGPDFTGVPGIPTIDTKGRYAWEKSARLKEKPFEVGPLAQMLIAYLNPSSADESVRRIVDATLAALGAKGKPEVLLSNLGRIAARTLKVSLVAQKALEYSAQLRTRMAGGDAEFYTIPPESPSGKGFSGWDAPRGSLAHWTILDGGKIKKYQIITPSGWNFAPRAGDLRVRGPVEEALVGTPVGNPEQPLEVLRTLHSFDP
jgi:hydrogenase large subunit